MKVHLGPYTRWVGPYQIAEKILFWKDKHDDKSVHALGKWLDKTPLRDICDFIHSKKKRREYVKVDYHDVWGLDHTLALIIHPTLQKLKECKHGCPHVDDEDVPAEIRTTAAAPKKNDWDTDNNWEARWDFVLDEMIWAFGEIKNGDWESKYHSGDHDMVFVPIDTEGNQVPEEDAKLFRMDKGPKDTHQFDHDGYMAHQAKIQNGLRLFAKYYFALWD